MGAVSSTEEVPRPGGDIRDIVAGVGRQWGWLLTWGVLSALFGICLLVRTSTES
jgi:hypothetical protein